MNLIYDHTIDLNLMNAQFLYQNLCIFTVPQEIRIDYGSMTHGAYVTYGTDELMEHLKLIKLTTSINRKSQKNIKI
jgi:hypothetical protein